VYWSVQAILTTMDGMGVCKICSTIADRWSKVLLEDNYKWFFSHTYRASWYCQSFFIHQLMHKWIVLKIILKFTLRLTLKQLRHVSVQSRHHQGAHYSCLLKLQLLK
jgi:hypothetical protein